MLYKLLGEKSMLETDWEYESASRKINGSSGVLASISESWSRCRDFGLDADTSGYSAPSTPQLPLVAYFCVHSLAVKSCFLGSFNNSCAISGTSGSFGLGSVSKDEIDSSTFEIVNAGLHWSLRMSRQMAPLLFTLQ